MARILFVLTGTSYWTPADGITPSTGHQAEEFAAPDGELTGNGHEVVVARPGGVVPHVDSMSPRPSMAGSAEKRGVTPFARVHQGVLIGRSCRTGLVAEEEVM